MPDKQIKEVMSCLVKMLVIVTIIIVLFVLSISFVNNRNKVSNYHGYPHQTEVDNSKAAMLADRAKKGYEGTQTIMIGDEYTVIAYVSGYRDKEDR